MSLQNKYAWQLFCYGNKCANQSVKSLIKKGASVNAVLDFFNESVFNALLDEGHCSTDTIQLFIDNGAVVNPKNGRFPPLYYACLKGDNKKKKNRAQLVQVLLENKANPNALHSTESYYQPVFHIAVNNKDTDVINLFLDYGVDVNVSDSLGKTPLQIAVQNKNKACIKLLLEYGADEQNDFFKASVYSQHKDIQDIINQIKLTGAPLKTASFGKNSPQNQPQQTVEAVYHKEDYLAMKEDELLKSITLKGGLEKLKQAFDGDFESFVKGVDYHIAMRVYVHIYRHLSAIEKEAYSKGVNAVRTNQPQHNFQHLFERKNGVER